MESDTAPALVIELRGTGSEVRTNFFPPLELDENSKYSLALLDLELYEGKAILDDLLVECDLIHQSYSNNAYSTAENYVQNRSIEKHPGNRLEERHVLYEIPYLLKPTYTRKVLHAVQKLIFLPLNTRGPIDTIRVRLLSVAGNQLALDARTTVVRLLLQPIDI